MPPKIPQAIAQGATPPRYGEVKIRNRGRLPHWEKEEGLYFITFHLGDSLPKHAIRGIIERQKILAAAKTAGAHLLPSQQVLVEKYSVKKMEAYIDQGSGACVLRIPQVAQAMVTAIQHGHGNRYRLVAWCIMPNHVHIICRLLPGHNLAEIVKSWKVYSARQANKILCRQGSLWQREYYDRLIRDQAECNRAVRYVLENPKKAGLQNWTWLWSEGQATGAA